MQRSRSPSSAVSPHRYRNFADCPYVRPASTITSGTRGALGTSVPEILSPVLPTPLSVQHEASMTRTWLWTAISNRYFNTSGCIRFDTTNHHCRVRCHLLCVIEKCFRGTWGGLQSRRGRIFCSASLSTLQAFLAQRKVIGSAPKHHADFFQVSL